MLKCIVLLILATAVQAFSKGYGQEKINVNLQNVSLRKAFKEIEKSTSYRFLFNDGLLPKDQNNINLNAVDADLDKVMPQLLSDSKLTYKLSSNLVIIAKAENIAQAVAVTGTVKDEKGEALIGVSVMEKGTSNGTATDVNGNYKITVSDAGATLVFKYLGSETKEVAVAGRTQLDVVLQASSSALTEVVVVGYGTRAKKDLTGTVNSLSGDEIVAAKATGVQEAMQGRLAGVDIKRSSGKPGSDFNIEIRGANSITGSTQPLYVIDGIPVGQNGSATNPINDINPADIDRIDVLKDASSTAIYGSRGANGVILVTTKRGSKGALKITYDGYVGTVNPYHLPPTMDGPTFVSYVRDYFNAQQGYPATPVPDAQLFSTTELANIAAGTYTNWIDLIKRNGISSNHNLSMSGGDEKTTYFASGGYQTYDGTMKAESTKKYTLKAGLDKNVGNSLKFGASLYSTFANIHPSSGEAFRSAYRLRPTGSAYNADGTERFFVSEAEAQITNPLFEFRNEIRQQQYVHLLPNVYGEGTIVKGLKLRSSFSPDITFQRQGQFNDTFSKQQCKEHGYTDKNTLNVPADWNSQDAKFLYYEGTVWYKKSFDYQEPAVPGQVYLYFGAVNYRADVYLNGKKLGVHKGGFTPFNFLVPEGLLKPAGNFLVVKVDNKRFKDEIPTLNTDWWNYGGITRDVKLIEAPAGFIQDYVVQLKRTYDPKIAEVEGWVKLDGPSTGNVTVEIPELKLKKSFPVTGGTAAIRFTMPKFQRWSPEVPKLYSVIVSSQSDRVEDKIGFRNIEVQGKQVLLNGKPLFMRGICIHGEMPEDGRRAVGTADAVKLLGWAKELSCNMVRLAHYPHDEAMVKVADSLGIVVWSEIPVYWTIDFTSKDVLAKAKIQLDEMIARDRNRASVIIWSVGNETPLGDARLAFMSDLVKTAKATDPSRLVSAALEVSNVNGVSTIDDPLGQYTDLVSVNEYIGWYAGLPGSAKTAKWETKYDKPLFFSETGAEAMAGFHTDSLGRWSEEYQEWFYKEQVDMMKRMPENFVGLSPWILTDFRSPRRNNPQYQEGWNNKGLIGHNGAQKKKAFYILKGYYDEMKAK